MNINEVQNLLGIRPDSPEIMDDGLHLEPESLFSRPKSLAAKSTVLKVSSTSLYKKPIYRSGKKLNGFSREWGDASIELKSEVVMKIIYHSKHLSVDDQALLLSIARLESGFNPDAASKKSSAVGVFQIIKGNWPGLNLREDLVFDMDSNIRAGIKLYQENLKLFQRKSPRLYGNEKAIALYALYHDGPSLNHGGGEIAKKGILPYFSKFKALTLEIRKKI